MKIEIDTELLIEEAFKYMEYEDDLRWPVGMALQELYWDEGWAEVQERLRQLYLDKAEANTYSITLKVKAND